MPDQVEQRMKRLGRLQREVLLWVGEQEGLTTPEEIRDRWPPTKRVEVRNPFDELRASAALVAGLRQGSTVKRQPYAAYVEDDYFRTAKRPEPGVRWSARRFLGRQPKPAESSALSNSVRNLADRGLLELIQAGTSGRRTTHVTLTVYGAVASVKLRLAGTAK